MKINEPDLSGSYTYADYFSWQWEEMTELIRGKIYRMSPAPTSKHQKVVGNLFGLLWSKLRGERCQVFTAPFDVRLPILSYSPNVGRKLYTAKIGGCTRQNKKISQKIFL
ncbi:MAG: Uma2 family endonuclease, partial [Cyclobacteriaceae bacterium]|nr:Uma2 family endonuclease [Cyclobacteriaceae bacterium]